MSNAYDSAKMNALIKKEYGARTTAARLAAIRQAQALSAKDVPIVPYWQGKMIVVARNNVQGVNRSLDAAYNLRFWLISKS
jgi:peptide/nickel transport system substrate-binding protein